MSDVEFVLGLIRWLNECQKVFYNFQDGVFYGWGPEGDPFEIEYLPPSYLGFTLRDPQTGKRIEVDEGGNVKKW